MATMQGHVHPTSYECLYCGEPLYWDDAYCAFYHADGLAYHHSLWTNGIFRAEHAATPRPQITEVA